MVARAHMRAVRAARRQREAEPAPVLRRRVEVAHENHDVVETDDVLKRHVAAPLALICAKR